MSAAAAESLAPGTATPTAANPTATDAAAAVAAETATEVAGKSRDRHVLSSVGLPIAGDLPNAGATATGVSCAAEAAAAGAFAAETTPATTPAATASATAKASKRDYSIGSGDSITTVAPIVRSASGDTMTMAAPTLLSPSGNSIATAAPTAPAPSAEGITTVAPTIPSPSGDSITTAAPTIAAPSGEGITTVAPTFPSPSGDIITTAAPTAPAPSGEGITTVAPTIPSPSGDIITTAALTTTSPSGEGLTMAAPTPPSAKGERQPELERARNSWFAHFLDGVLQVWLCYAWPSAAHELAAFAVVVVYVAFTLAQATATNDSGWIGLLTFTLVGCWAAAKLRQRTWVAELQGAALTFSGSKFLRSNDFGVWLYVQQGSLKEGDSTDPVVLKHESEAIICDGHYLFVKRTVNFGPKGMKFAKPLILEFSAGKNDTIACMKGEGGWHNCPDEDLTIVYRGGLRYLRLRVHHFCAFGLVERVVELVARPPWSRPRWSRSGRVVVTNISPAHGSLLCIVYPYKWVENHLVALSAKLAALGLQVGASMNAELTAFLSEDRNLKRQVKAFSGQEVFSIPKEQGHNVSLVLARVLDKEVTVFTEIDVEVGSEVRVDLSKLIPVLPYDTVSHGKNLLSRLTRTLKDHDNGDSNNSPAPSNNAELLDAGTSSSGASGLSYSSVVSAIVVMVLANAVWVFVLPFLS